MEVVGSNVCFDADRNRPLIDCAGSLGTQLLDRDPDQYTKCGILLAEWIPRAFRLPNNDVLDDVLQGLNDDLNSTGPLVDMSISDNVLFLFID